MAVKIKIAGEFDPRAFDAAEQRLARLKDKSMANSQSMQGSFMRTGASVIGFGDTLSAAGTNIANTGDKLTRNVTLPLLGVGAIAFKTAADFEQSMNKVQAASDASAQEMKTLEALAKKFGAETVFSANEAAGATLELAKAGLTPAQIAAGALEASLQLAAAGGLSMEEAATVAANAINTFKLEADDAGMVADALAGGANASSANVTDLQQALAQAGTVANAANLSINDTVGTLALFADRGIKGSDAGTSLKTMLSRLVPQTDAAAKAMEKYGLSFVDAKGNYKDITTIAQDLKDKLGGLSQAERDAAIQTIFGSDAKRAALLLMDAGSKGTKKYIAATKDREAAEKMADAAMKGSKGSIEEMMGSLETAALTVGQSLAPTVTDLAENVGSLADKFSKLDEGQQKTIIKYALMAAAAGPVLSVTGRLINVVGGLTQGVGHAIVNTGRFIGGLRGVEGASSTTAGKIGIFFKKVGTGSVTGAKAIGKFAKDMGTSLVSNAKTAGTAISDLAKGTGTALVNGLKTAGSWAATAGGKMLELAKGIGRGTVELAKSAAAWVADTAKKVANTAATWASIAAQKAAAFGAKLWAGAQWLLNAAMSANPIGLVVVAIGALVAGFVIAWKKSEKFREVVTGAWNAVKNGAIALWNGVVGVFKKFGPGILAAVAGPLGGVVGFIVKNWDKIKSSAVNAFSAVVTWVKSVPGKIKSGLGDLGQLLWNAGTAIITGLWNGLKSKWESVKSWVGGIATWIKDHKGPEKYDRKLLVKNGQAIMLGLREGLGRGWKLVQHDVLDFNADLKKAAGEGLKAVTKVVEREATQLAGKLEKAYSKLDEAKQKMADYAAGIQDTFSSYADLGSVDKATSAQEFIDQLQKRKEAAAQFATDIKKLREMGLKKGAIDELLAAGVEGGGKTASMLAAGSKEQIAQINALQSDITDMGAKLGSKLSKDYYQAGVNAAHGLVKGLESQSGALVKVAGLVSSTLVKSIKKELKIKSPSKVTGELGSFAGEGFVDNVAQWAPKAGKAGSALSQELADSLNPAPPAFGRMYATKPLTGARGVQQVTNNYNTYYQIGDVTIPANDKAAQEAIKTLLDSVRRAKRMQPQGA